MNKNTAEIEELTSAEAVAEARRANIWAKRSLVATTVVGLLTVGVSAGAVVVASQDHSFAVESRELSEPDIRETYVGPGQLSEGEAPRYLLRNVGGQGTEVLGAYYRERFMPVISPAGAKLEIAAGGGDVLQLMPCYLARSLGPDEVATTTDALDLAVGTREERKSIRLEKELVDLINGEHSSLVSTGKCSNGQSFDNLQFQYLEGQTPQLLFGTPGQTQPPQEG